mgnify:CR=1 FL=1
MKTLLKLVFLIIFITPFSTLTAQFTFNSSIPTTSANNIALDASVVLNFSASIQTVSLTESNIRITGKTTGIIDGTYSGGGTQIITFNPDDNFAAGEVVTVTITAGLQNTSGANLSNPTSICFTTKSSLNPFTPSWKETEVSNTIEGNAEIFGADLDNDGDVDLISTSQDNNTISWYENDGNGASWTATEITSAATSAGSLYAADIDNDGDVDIVAILANSTINWYENNGNGSSWTVREIASGLQ